MGTYYYESQKTSYPPYLAHYGVKGMKWGVRHDPRTMMGNQIRYIRERNADYRNTRRAYRRTKGQLMTRRNQGHISEDQFQSQLREARRAKRRARSQSRLEGRKKYYSKVSQGRGIAGSILLTVGGDSISKIAKLKTMESIATGKGKKKVAAYAGLALAGDVASTVGQVGGYLEVRRGIDKYKGRIR